MLRHVCGVALADPGADIPENALRVCVGEVGAILRLEVSRLARSSADLQRLLQLCVR
jgi:hypothetical protein